jgi:hypothetical protein
MENMKNDSVRIGRAFTWDARHFLASRSVLPNLSETEVL